MGAGALFAGLAAAIFHFVHHVAATIVHYL